MRTALWPDSVDEHASAIDDYFDGKPSFIDQIVVCQAGNGELAGFAELRIRNYAEGSSNMAVPYLEGWYVDSAHRRRGVGKALIAAAEEWARSMGYSELASDAEINDQRSITAHVALGFHETDRCVCFLKKI